MPKLAQKPNSSPPHTPKAHTGPREQRDRPAEAPAWETWHWQSSRESGSGWKRRTGSAVLLQGRGNGSGDGAARGHTATSLGAPCPRLHLCSSPKEKATLPPWLGELWFLSCRHRGEARQLFSILLLLRHLDQNLALLHAASSGVPMGVMCCGPLSGSLHTHHLPEECTAPHQAFSEGICQHHTASSLTPPPAQRNRGNSNKLLKHPKQTSLGCSSGYACCPCPPPATPVIPRRTLAPPLPAPGLRREPRRDARPLAPPLPAPREQLISFRCYYCVVMVNLPTPPIRGARMGEAVIRVNLIRNRFI